MDKRHTGTPRISVIICTRNRPDQIGIAVESVLRSTHPSFDLLVVDQSTDRCTEEALRPYVHDPRLRLMRIPSQGQSIARNVGLWNTCGEIVAFTDDDCVAAPDWIDQVSNAFAAHPEAPLLFGRVEAPPWYEARHGFVPVHYPQTRSASASTWALSFGIGANMCLRRELLSQIGYFDEALGPGARGKAGDDVDFAVRAWRAGNRILNDPGPGVVHEGGVRPRGRAASMWYRDGFAAGTLGLKALKCRRWRELVVILGPILVQGPGFVLKAIVTGRRPLTLRRVAYQVLGVLHGLVSAARWRVHHSQQGCHFDPPCATLTPGGAESRL